MGGERTCPHCRAANPLDLAKNCVRCRKRLPLYCFSCYAPIAGDKTSSCENCGRRRWIVGDFADLPCTSETASAVTRRHRYMETRMKAGKVVHQWRCMKCFAEDQFTDAFTHFPDRPLVEV